MRVRALVSFRSGIVAATACVLITMPGFASLAEASPVGIGGFGSSAITEGFEGTLIGASNPGCTACFGAPDGYSFPGVVTTFTFGSGLSLFSPSPNPGLGNDLYVVGDFARNAGVRFVTIGSGVLDAASQLPDGTAFFAASRVGLNTPITAISVEFALPASVVRVGAYLTGDGPALPITMEVLDGSGTVLETATINSVDVDSWDDNFLGIENAGDIRRVRFTAPVAVESSTFLSSVLIDGLIFELAAAPVPEPASLPLVVAGLAILAALRWRRMAARLES